MSSFVHLISFPQGIEKSQASLLISVIGITNTFARIICGYVSDFPSVDSLFLNNCCLVLCTISVGITPLCSSFTSYVIMAFFFGLAIGMKCSTFCALSLSKLIKFLSSWLHLIDFHHPRRLTRS